MPLHLDTLLNEQDPGILSYILGTALGNCSSAFSTEDKQFFIGRSDIVDIRSGDVIGRLIYTLWANPETQNSELLDIDIVLCNDQPTPIHFLNRLSGSSASNEYYDAELTESAQRFQLETVSRYTVPQEITDTTRDVYISIFPYELSLFDSISDLNQALGFDEHHPIGKTGFIAEGLSETFIAPGSIFSNQDTDATSSFVVGTVESFKDVTADFGVSTIDFVIAMVRTALGVVPVAMSRDVFDLEKLKPGAAVAMFASVKADLSKSEDFKF